MKELVILGPCRIDTFKEFLDAEQLEYILKNNLNGTGGTPVNELVKYYCSKKLYKIILVTYTKVNIRNYIAALGTNIDIYFVKKHRYSSLDFFYRDTKVLLQVLKKIKPKLIHSHWPIYSVAALFYSRKNTLVTLHDNPYNILKIEGVKHLNHFLMSVFVYLYAKNITVISNHIIPFAKKFNSNVKLTRNIHDLTKLQSIQQNIDEDYIKITMIGNSSKLKNILPTVELFFKFKNIDKKILLNIVGPGLDEAKNRYKNTENLVINFLGEISHNKVLELINGSHLVIHPSLEEALPGPVIESILLEKPVITNKNIGDIPYLLGENYQNITNIEFHLEQTIINIIDNYTFEIEEIKAIKEKLLKKMNKNFIAKEYMEYYEL